VNLRVRKWFGRSGRQLAVAGAVFWGGGLCLGAGEPILFPRGRPVLPASSLALQAGDPIIFPAVQARMVPFAESKYDEALLNSTESAPRSGLRAAPSSGASPRSVVIDPKAARKMQSRRRERDWSDESNQTIKDEDFGIRDYSAESIERQDFNQDPTFKDFFKAKSSGRAPNAGRDSSYSEEETAKANAQGARPSSLGAHQVSELDMKQMFNLDPTHNALSPDKSDFSLGDFLFGPDSARLRNSQARPDDASRFLDAPKPGDAPVGSAGAPNSIPGLGQSGVNPLLPAAPEATFKNPAAVAPPPGRDFGRAGNPGSPYSSPSSGYGPGVSGYSSLPSSSFRPSEPNRARLDSTRPEPPRRRF